MPATDSHVITIDDSALAAFLDDREYNTEPTTQEWWELFTDAEATCLIGDADSESVFVWDKDVWPQLIFGVNELDGDAYLNGWVRMRPEWPTLETSNERASWWFAGESKRDRAEHAIRLFADLINQAYRDALRMAAELAAA